MILEWILLIDMILIVVLSMALKSDWIFYNTPYGTEHVMEELVGYLSVFFIFILLVTVGVKNY